MTKEDTINRINEFLSEEFEVEVGRLQPDAILKDTLELDSLDYVDLVVLLESNFSIKVKQEDFTSIRTFQDLYNYVIAKTQA
ncbi:MAG: acyl carrier protein [Bacteroidetes bacterium]|nr:acyl carrier protein [Bacteroidota bacterium]MBS1685489.1 acyl carrier protein [Bacteroidota bacterium]